MNRKNAAGSMTVTVRPVQKQQIDIGSGGRRALHLCRRGPLLSAAEMGEQHE
jgi:hypothetical protein